MQYVMGIDVGTSGTKTALFDTKGTLVCSKTIEYPMQQPQNGWAEQNPEDWWHAAKKGIRAVLSESKIAANNIIGIGLSGQMHSLVMLDEDNEVLRPAILWCDGRTAKECEEIYERVGKERYLEITCNPALTGFTAGKILWVRHHEPNIYAKCRHIMLPKDFIRLKLTGAYATEVSDASGMGLLDVPNRCWSDEVLDALEIDKAWLPGLYESVEVTGTISEEAAAQTGLAQGTIVVGGAGDNAAAAVGTGVVTDGKAFVTIGTSGVVFAHTDTLSVDPQGRVHTFCCAVPHAWHVMGVTLSAGASLQWFRNQCCKDIMELASVKGTEPYDLMTDEASKSSIGANKLLFLPYLMGERTPHLNPNCRGAFLGLSGMHVRGDLIRAVMEGVTYSLKDCNEILQEMGVTSTQLIACGGGGTSAFWRQMLADVLGYPVSTVSGVEGPALGAALLAAVGAGVYSTVQEACNACVTALHTQQPDAVQKAQYEVMYPIYRSAYRALQQINESLASI